MVKFVKLTPNSKPEDVLELPVGRLVLGMFQVAVIPEDVVECAQLIINKGGRDNNFYSQAGVIEYAGNNLGWGTGEGYKVI